MEDRQEMIRGGAALVQKGDHNATDVNAAGSRILVMNPVQQVPFESRVISELVSLTSTASGPSYSLFTDC